MNSHHEQTITDLIADFFRVSDSKELAPTKHGDTLRAKDISLHDLTSLKVDTIKRQLAMLTGDTNQTT